MNDFPGGRSTPAFVASPAFAASSIIFRASSWVDVAGWLPRPPSSSPRPTRFAIASAVDRLSPVTMTTRTPAWRHSEIARATSALGGSSIPTKPRKVRSRSSSTETFVVFGGVGRIASASTLSDDAANFCSLSLSAARIASVSGSAAPDAFVSACVHFARTVSAAPFVNKMLCPFLDASTDIIFRSRVKSNAATRLNCPAQYSAQYPARSFFDSRVSADGIASNPGRPIFSVSTRSATSVLSPIFSYARVLPLYVSEASLQSDAQIDMCSTDALSAGCSTTLPLFASVTTPSGEYPSPVTSYSARHASPTRAAAAPAAPSDASTTQTLVASIAFVVSVPVLSEQITLVHPSVSTLGSDRTIAFCFAIFLVPSARHVVTTAGSPSGIAATASATAILK